MSTFNLNQNSIVAAEFHSPKQGQQARLLHEELLNLHQQISTTFLEVGVRLKKIRDRDLYQFLQHANFTAYVKSLEFSRSRAYALIGVVEDFYLSSRLDKPQMIAIGWEKLMLLRNVKDAVSFTKWVLRAQQMGKRQLRQALVDADLLQSQGHLIKAESTTEIIANEANVVEEKPCESAKESMYYLAVKKMTAVKWLSKEEIEAAKASGNYPLIIGVSGYAHDEQGGAQGLPKISAQSALPLLKHET
jgi:hypothetical protein